MGKVNLSFGTQKGKLQGPYIFQGKKYRSINEVSQAMGVPRYITQKLLEEGETPDAIYSYVQRDAEDKRLKKEQRAARIETIYKEYKGQVGVIDKRLKEIIRQSVETGEDLQELIEKNQAPVYKYDGQVFKYKYQLAEHLRVTTDALNWYLKKYNGDIEKVAEMLKKGYYYDDKHFETIEQLAEYTGIEDNTLEHWLIIYEKNAEKTIFILKINDMRDKKIKIQFPEQPKAHIDTAELSILLGMKQRELCLAMYEGQSIEELKSKGYRPIDSINLGYSKKLKLLKHCIKNNIDFKYYCVLMETYGQSFEKIIKTDKTGRELLQNCIIEKYGALLRVLDDQKVIDHTKIISGILISKLSIEELIENYILQRKCKELKINFLVLSNIYSLYCTEIMDEEKRDKLLQRISPTDKEIECIRNVQKEMEEVRNLIKLNRIAHVLKSDCSDEEKEKCLKENEVTLQEIETIVLDLYDEYDPRKDIGYGEKERQQRKHKRATTIRWTYMTEKQRNQLKESGFFIEEEIEEIASKSNLLEHYKRIIQSFNREESEQSNGEISSN